MTDVHSDGPLSISEAVNVLDQAAAQSAVPRENADIDNATTEPDAGVAAENTTPDADKNSVDGPVADASSDVADAADSADATSVRTPPPHWNAKEREAFASLPPDVQDALIAQEGKRESVVQRARQDAAQAKVRADAQSAEIARRVQFLDRILPAAAQNLQGRWAGVDWVRLPLQVGAEQAAVLKAQFEQEQQQLATLAQEQIRAEAEQHQNFVRSESEKLKVEAPELIDPKDGRTRMKALGDFLVSEGFPAERISLMSAKEAAIAYDAMRWRQAQAKARAVSSQKPAQQTQGGRATAAAVRPSAAAEPRSSETRANDAFRRLARSGRIDDAVAYLNARSPQG